MTSEISNEVNGVNEAYSNKVRFSPGWNDVMDANEQANSGRYPTTAPIVGRNESQGRRTWSVQDNRFALDCHFTSIPERRGYRQRMITL